MDRDSAGLEIQEAELGVGVTMTHPLLGKTSRQEPNLGEVRTNIRVPPDRKSLCWGKARLSEGGGGRRGSLRKREAEPRSNSSATTVGRAFSWGRDRWGQFCH